MEKKYPVKQASLPEAAQIWDVSTSKFVTAYRKDFKRQTIITLLDKITFDNVISEKPSEGFDVAAYARGLLLIDLAVTATPTDIIFDVEFSFDNSIWFRYVIGPFGDLRYEDAAGDKKECLDFPILAPFLRVNGIATGTTGSNKFTATVRAVLNG